MRVWVTDRSTDEDHVEANGRDRALATLAR
jgi:hypothetical protein